jgi:hypothetical protein
MMDLRTIARALGGEVIGRDQVLAPGPEHRPKDRSLSVRLSPHAPGGFIVHSHAGDDWRVCRDHVIRRLAIVHAPERQPSDRSATARPLRVDVQDARNLAIAIEVFQEARDPRGTAVELYLQRRGLALPNDAARRAIRFHPRCPFAGSRTSAMVCLVRDVSSNSPRGIHRTALNLDGEKVRLNGKDRLALGQISGGAIKFTPDEEVTTCLGIGEGVETTLSMRRVPEFDTSPVWSVLSAGGVRRFSVLSGIECLWIAVDHDPVGLSAARAAAERWRCSGAEAFLITPSAPQADLNDLMCSGASHA